MRTKDCFGLALAVTLASSASGLDENKGPAEADLYLHLKNAFKNPGEQPGLPRVLLIGDSISIGYTIPVRKQLEGKANIFRPPVNCQHTGYGLAHLKTWLGTNKWDVIHFNWGIWDTHLLDEKGTLVPSPENMTGATPLHIRYTPEQYRENLTALVKILKGTGAKLIWADSTPVMSRTGARFEDIIIRNAVADEIMRAEGVAINDLYHFVLPNVKEWQHADRVHFNDTGCNRLGERVSEAILSSLR